MKRLNPKRKEMYSKDCLKFKIGVLLLYSGFYILQLERRKYMEKDIHYYENKYITIPNLLSFFRLCLIPLIVWLYCFEKQYMESAVVIIISGITDVVDGFIARRFHMISNFGKFIDPFADKMTQMVVLACLSSRYPYMMIPCVLLFVKEFISFFSAYFAYKKTGVVMSAKWHGKMSTALLYLTIFVHIVWIDMIPLVSKGMTSACTGLIFYSFVMYEKEHVKRILQKV